MIIIFIGPPLVGKGTQAKILSEKLDLPLFSIGAILRSSKQKAYEKYAMKGKNLPTELKFNLLEEKMNENKNGFILENFPATKDDLDTLIKYLSQNNLKVDKVFNLTISYTEMSKRMKTRERADDTEEIVSKRQEIQSKDREPVIDYFKNLEILVNINGEGSVENVANEIFKNL